MAVGRRDASFREFLSGHRFGDDDNRFEKMGETLGESVSRFQPTESRLGVALWSPGNRAQAVCLPQRPGGGGMKLGFWE